MFGAGENVDKTARLFRLLKKYKDYSKKFLAAKGSLICSRLKYKGKLIEPSELPERAKTIRRNIVSNYKYRVKL